MAITPNTTFVSGAILTAAQQNNFPRGVVALTSNATQTITAGVLVGLNTTYTFEAGRTYKISTSSGWTVSGDILLEIYIAGVSVQRYVDTRSKVTSAGLFAQFNGFWVGSVAAGSKQVTIVVTVLSGAGLNVATTANPNQLVIEDIGTA
jgi:hypothetical protein